MTGLMARKDPFVRPSSFTGSQLRQDGRGTSPGPLRYEHAYTRPNGSSWTVAAQRGGSITLWAMRAAGRIIERSVGYMPDLMAGATLLTALVVGPYVVIASLLDHRIGDEVLTVAMGPIRALTTIALVLLAIDLIRAFASRGKSGS
jgi:hypothetical protein